MPALLFCFSLILFSPPRHGLCSRNSLSSLPGISEANLYSHSPPCASCCHLGTSTPPHPLTDTPLIDGLGGKNNRTIATGGHERHAHTHPHTQTIGTRPSIYLSCIILLKQLARKHTHARTGTHSGTDIHLKRRERRRSSINPLKFRHIAFVMRLARKSSSAISGSEMSPKL